jgi:hypothetical protein
LKRFHFFTRVVKFFYDLLTYEDVRLLFRRDRRTLFNLNRLNREKRDSNISRRLRKKNYLNSNNILSFNILKKKNKEKKAGGAG